MKYMRNFYYFLCLGLFAACFCSCATNSPIPIPIPTPSNTTISTNDYLYITNGPHFGVISATNRTPLIVHSELSAITSLTNITFCWEGTSDLKTSWTVIGNTNTITASSGFNDGTNSFTISIGFAPYIPVIIFQGAVVPTPAKYFVRAHFMLPTNTVFGYDYAYESHLPSGSITIRSGGAIPQ